jgi:hypothetical protein
MEIKYLLSATIVLSSLCLPSIKSEAMTDENRQEVIKIIYKDPFFSLPKNRHYRDELIKKIHDRQLEIEQIINHP